MKKYRKKGVLRKFKKTAVAIAVSAAATLVQADGRIEGQVNMGAKGVSTEGAMVSIKALNIETVTRRNGSYSLPALPAGEYQVTVNYLGAPLVTRSVVVTDGKTQTENFIIKSVDAMEEVLVVGQVAGVNKALNKQRSADNIISVVSADAIGQFPDSNVSESLSRITGISIERDQGEGRFVRVRGLSPDLNSVTINGSKVTAPGGGGRAVGLDVVPADLVESLEVTKSLTPDKDADGLGGTIEVKSLSAFDRDGLFYTLSAESSYDDNSEKTSPKAALTASNQFDVLEGDNNLGIAASLSWQDRDFGSDNVETGGGWNFDDSPARLEELEQRHYVINRERLGAGLNIDYHSGVDDEYYLRTLYNRREDTESRNAVIVEFSDPLLPGELGTAEVERELKSRVEQQKIISVVLGGINRTQDWTLDYAAGYSEATEKKPTFIDGAIFKSSDDITPIAFNNTETPSLSSSEAMYDVSAFELDEVATGAVDAKDSEYNVRVDISRELQWNDKASEVKFGAKMSRRSKRSDEQVLVYAEFPSELSALSEYDTPAPGYALDRFGPGISDSAVRSVLSQAGEVELDLEKSNVDDYSIDEDINAAYAMVTVDFDQLRLLTGIRYEGTDMSASGHSYDDASETVAATRDNKDYDHWLPALHARYKFSENSIARAAWTHAVVRPTFEQLSPGLYIDGDEAEFGNSQLDPWESTNFDIGYEYYFGAASSASVFVFYKDIEDFVYETELDDYAGYDKVNTFINGDTAEILGLEISYSQKFNKLPAPWNGFLISANATLTDSEADLGNRDVPLPSQSDTVANLSVGYENAWMSLRLSGNYKSEYLLEVGESKVQDSYVDSQMQVDFTARFWLTEQLQLSLHGVNLTDQEYYVYNNNPRYNHQYESYGPTFKIGLQLTHF